VTGTNKIFFKIEGEVGKYKTVSIDYLIKVASHLQSLVQDIAKYDLPSEESISLDDFKLELVGFKTGSAIPIFDFRKESQSAITPVAAQRKICSDKLNTLLTLSGNGDYMQLKKLYPEPDKRTIMTTSLFGFVQSIGSTPVTVRINGRKPHKVKPFKKEILKRLVGEVVATQKIKEQALAQIQLAKVEVIDGRPKPKVLELYPKKYSSIGFAPEVITHEDAVYELRHPLLSTMERNEDGQVIIENKQLGIYAYGDDDDAAENMFNEEFDYLYKRYNQLPDSQLTDDVKFIKSILNNMVIK
jgi:hypothetical protein